MNGNCFGNVQPDKLLENMASLALMLLGGTIYRKIFS